MTARLALVALAALATRGHAAPAAPPRLAAVDRVVARHIVADVPGCAVGVYRAGEVVHAAGYGLADLERGVPITAATRFDIASISKQLTAASVLLLAADGALALDDDVRKFLPELPALGPAPTTLRHLLHHTGGLRDYEVQLVLAGTRFPDVATRAETLALLARQTGRDFAPGARWEYSNTGYFLLSQVVERVAKQSLPAFAAARIFGPLKMTDTLYLDDHARVVPGRALAYQRDTDRWVLSLSNWEQTGDGAVQTSVLDLARWDANFLRPVVGGAALIAALERRGALASGEPLRYAAGLFHGSYRSAATIEHDGGWAGYRSVLIRFPAQQTTIAVLCNTPVRAPREIAYDIADALFGATLPPRKPPRSEESAQPTASPPYRPPAAALASAAGRYLGRELNRVWTLEVRAGQLVAHTTDVEVPLTAVAPGRFTGAFRLDVDRVLELAIEVVPGGLVVGAGAVTGLRFDRITAGPRTPRRRPP